MLHPHLRLPVETGLRCLLLCEPWLPEQPVNMKKRTIQVKRNNWRIPGFEVIFFTIFISLIIRFFHIISPGFSTNNPSACSEKNSTEDAGPEIYANLALIIVW